MYQDISTQSQDQGCFMFKTLGIFFQWILKIWIHSCLGLNQGKGKYRMAIDIYVNWNLNMDT